MRANSRVFSTLLSNAVRKGSNLQRLLALEVLLPPRLPWWREPSPIIDRLRKGERLEPQEIRDLAQYLAAAFNILADDAQREVLDALLKVAPEIAWERAIGEGEQVAERLTQGKRPLPVSVSVEHTLKPELPGGTGPRLLPSASMDDLLGLFRRVSARTVVPITSILDDEFGSEIADDSDKRRVLYWSTSLFDALRVRAADVVQVVPGLFRLTTGFLDPETEADDFGVIALALSDERDGPTRLPDIEIDGRAFPVFVRRIVANQHAWPSSHPSKGTLACWAKTRLASSKPRFGAVTAKHVVGSRIGRRIQTAGATWKVRDVAPEGIDAALVETPERFDERSPLLKALKLVPQWLDVTFNGAESGKHRTKVTAITDQLGILDSPLVPVRLLLAAQGRPGDSGALVLEADRSTPRAVGIYIAGHCDVAGRGGGLAQHMQQAVEIMDMELYR
jgi:hypothetical protein